MVIDTDGSAFITKAEFDSLKNNFQAQIDSYNSSIDSKIDGAIASYLSGIQLSSETQITFYNDLTSLSWVDRIWAKFGWNGKWYKGSSVIADPDPAQITYPPANGTMSYPSVEKGKFHDFGGQRLYVISPATNIFVWSQIGLDCDDETYTLNRCGWTNYTAGTCDVISTALWFNAVLTPDSNAEMQKIDRIGRFTLRTRFQNDMYTDLGANSEWVYGEKIKGMTQANPTQPVSTNNYWKVIRLDGKYDLSVYKNDDTLYQQTTYRNDSLGYVLTSDSQPGVLCPDERKQPEWQGQNGAHLKNCSFTMVNNGDFRDLCLTNNDNNDEILYYKPVEKFDTTNKFCIPTTNFGGTVAPFVVNKWVDNSYTARFKLANNNIAFDSSFPWQAGPKTVEKNSEPWEEKIELAHSNDLSGFTVNSTNYDGPATKLTEGIVLFTAGAKGIARLTINVTSGAKFHLQKSKFNKSSTPNAPLQITKIGAADVNQPAKDLSSGTYEFNVELGDIIYFRMAKLDDETKKAQILSVSGLIISE